MTVGKNTGWGYTELKAMNVEDFFMCIKGLKDGN